MPQHSEAQGEGFSFWITVAFTLNYILGSGFLTLPWTFEQTGVLLGILVLGIIGFFSTISVFFILEAIDRGQRLLKYVGENGIELASLKSKANYSQIRDASYHNPEEAPLDEESSAISPNSQKMTAITDSISSPIHSSPSQRSSVSSDSESSFESQSGNEVTTDIVPAQERKLEIIELSGLFLGNLGQQIYAGVIIVYMYGTLWAYCAVFAKAFAAHLPLSPSPYVLYAIIFGILVIPASLMEFKEQVAVQVSLSLFRVVMVSVMVITCLIAQYRGDNEFGFSTDRSGDFPSKSNVDAWKFEPSQMYYLLPVAAYAYIFHHSVPSLADTAKDKQHLAHLFRTALVISMVAYMAVGTIVALYFGDAIDTTSNLNWGHYRGPQSSTAKDNDVPVYASIVSFFVVLFPAIDVASAYPLNAYTLGNNLMGMYYGKETYKHENSRWKLSLFRALAAAPPIFGGLLVSKVEQITAYTGLTAFGLAFVFPPLLARYSAKTLAEIGLPVSTPHSSVWTSEPFQWLLFLSGIAIFITVFVCLQVGPE